MSWPLTWGARPNDEIQTDRTIAHDRVARVEPVTLSLLVKDDLAARMLRVFQRGKITIPDEQRLLADLHSVEKQVTAAGKVRYVAALWTRT